MCNKFTWNDFKEQCGHRLLDGSEEFYECTINEDKDGNYEVCCLEKNCPLLNKIK